MMPAERLLVPCLKARMSTKMIGETLEIHCSTQFNQTLRSMMPRAYFEKDNDASGGSKGDFIFRDFGEDGTEYISVGAIREMSGIESVAIDQYVLFYANRRIYINAAVRAKGLLLSSDEDSVGREG